MFFLAEFIPIVFSPLVFLGALIALSLLLKKRWLGVVALLALWALSTPFVANKIWQSLETNQRLARAQTYSPASAIVVLSGMARLSESSQGLVFEWEQASDRFWAGVDLFQAGKAPLLVFTGGRQPWSASKQTEGQWLAQQALRFGIAQDRIKVSAEVRNTAQEAQAVAALISQRDILLVTSAFHMPRAQKIFQDAGFRVTPVPVDFQQEVDPQRWSDFFPRARELRKSSDAIREWIGRLYYQV